MKDGRRAIILVTGIQAAGKSTVGRLLAERFERGVFIEGDLMWKAVVSGREDVTPEPTAEAVRQLFLRHRAGTLLADHYFSAGFTVVHCDIVLGDQLLSYIEWVRGRPLLVVVLRPRPDVVVAREIARGSDAYRGWGDDLRAAVEEFDGWLEEGERLGLWLNTSEQTPEETVDEIVRRVFSEGLVGTLAP